jgi:glycosyltransferase involved in cell wall biosynthesis
MEVIQPFLQDPRLRLYRREVNRGVNAVCNFGLEHAAGEYVFGLSADDRVLPGFFSKILAVLQKHPGLGLCCSDFASFQDAVPDQIHTQKLLNTNQPYHVFHPHQTLELFRKTSFWIPGHTSVLRTQYAREYGGYQEALKQFSDFYLFHKVALLHSIGYVPEPLSGMRMVSNSFSAQCFKDKKRLRKTACVLLDLALKDQARREIRKSTILRTPLRALSLRLIFFPRYWRFLMPFLKKKIFVLFAHTKTLLRVCAGRVYEIVVQRLHIP